MDGWSRTRQLGIGAKAALRKSLRRHQHAEEIFVDSLCSLEFVGAATQAQPQFRRLEGLGQEFLSSRIKSGGEFAIATLASEARGPRKRSVIAT
jgi:hypothetical protein